MASQPEAAAAFARMHNGADVLVLANAWDAGSARVIEAAGGKAIATSSAAVAWSHGYADGHDLPISRLVATVEEIARAVRAPVSADAEGGYAEDPAEVGENVAALVRAGAVGINLEDGRASTDLHCAKIAAAREAGARAGVDLFINARVDVYLKKLVAAEAALDETIKRGKAVKAAGASGFFVPGVVSRDEIAAIAGAVDLPLNVLAFPGLPPLAELRALGVRRLSAGALPGRVALAATRAAAETFLRQGDSAALIAAAGPSVDYNALFKG
ncbi:MAG TPA: isocitrate lyase/phosphoenolpyruvate mutase family protein [Caulobacterales bacterium]|nr:isocitrate lyase/phosphoenolpyruvate mutase family protein [Caulobacterales bacterium]